MNTPADDRSENAVAPLQRDMQRLLGRCLLRIQMYERLLKAVLIGHELSGPLSVLQAVQAKRQRKFHRQTLGQLVGELFGTVIQTTDAPRKDPCEPSGGIDFAMRFSVEVSDHEMERLRKSLANLVTLRNALVHHFFEQFDIGSARDCAAAVIYLEDAYKTVDSELHLLRGIALGFETARGQAVLHIQPMLDAMAADDAGD